ALVKRQYFHFHSNFVIRLPFLESPYLLDIFMFIASRQRKQRTIRFRNLSFWFSYSALVKKI
ncbi:unnamed protein product, partial [Nesidiocoris tenuis]